MFAICKGKAKTNHAINRIMDNCMKYEENIATSNFDTDTGSL